MFTEPEAWCCEVSFGLKQYCAFCVDIINVINKTKLTEALLRMR